MLVTSVMAVIAGVLLCFAIVSFVARKCGLPIRETLMWLGLAEPDGETLERACARLERAEARLSAAAERRSRGWPPARTDSHGFAGP